MLIKRFEPLFGAEAARIPKPVNVDSTVFGTVVPFELYIQTKDPRYFCRSGQDLADAPMGNAARTPSRQGAAAPVKFQVSPGKGSTGSPTVLTWQTPLLGG